MVARDQVFKAAPWDSVEGIKRLALVRTRDESEGWVEGDPKPGWTYTYAMPSDLIQPINLHDYHRFDPGAGKGIRVIFTQIKDPILIYTRAEEDLSVWDSTLYGAVAAALGYNISLRLSGKLAFTENAAQRANSVIIEARVAHANQTDDRYEVIPEWIAVRGYDYTPPAQRFIYPYGPLIGMDNIARNSSNS